MAWEAARIKIESFNGLDARRSPARGYDYGYGQDARNLGRSYKRPLECRPTGARCSAAGSQVELAGPAYAFTIMERGSEVVLVWRAPGGQIRAIRGITTVGG